MFVRVFRRQFKQPLLPKRDPMRSLLYLIAVIARLDRAIQ
jgi:hypothetical protein